MKVKWKYFITLSFFLVCDVLALTESTELKNLQYKSEKHINTTDQLNGQLFFPRKQVICLSRDASESNKQGINIEAKFANLNAKEKELAYFREDVGVQVHHYFWHATYPSISKKKKNRNGELFFYMHQQMVARYNFERLSNGLPRVTSFNNWNVPIPEEYDPNLNNTAHGGIWVPRKANSYLADGKFGFLSLNKTELLVHTQRIFEAIHVGYIIGENGELKPLDVPNSGIDRLGYLVESSNFSDNRNYYGDLHNHGHTMLAFAHFTIKGEHGKSQKLDLRPAMGVMGHNSVACRDPVFYRWHKFIGDIFYTYKDKLKPYGKEELGFPGVALMSVDIYSEGTEAKNELITFWTKDELDINQGIDFTYRKQMNGKAIIEHLQHKNFFYIIKVQNNRQNPVKGTIRIFLSPKYDVDGCRFTWDIQKRLSIEMDKFEYEFNEGLTTIQRLSCDSSVTLPFEEQFHSKAEINNDYDMYFCSCGWPQHLLIPKGRYEGMESQLFVMISDYKDDYVEPQNSRWQSCKPVPSYCGLRNRLYPDKRPMGFPFDRKLDENIIKTKNSSISDLEKFVDVYPNMIISDIKIRFIGNI